MEGRYRVEKEIAQGGAARVFLAYDPDGQRVALKVLRPQLAVTVTADRFIREIGFLSKLDHPGICKLLDYGESGYFLYYVMPYVEGPTVREHLNRSRRASVGDTMRIARDLLDALGYAHHEGIVHRDVKPENIVLTRERTMLVDFGIARAIAESGTNRLTRSGYAIGTSTYMSPEQARGATDLDHRSDLYSLGCVLFECLTGKPPFASSDENATLRMHLENDAPSVASIRSDLPEPLVEGIDTALARQRRSRWQTAGEMLEKISAAID